MDYSPILLIRLIQNYDLIDTFVTSTTSTLTPANIEHADTSSSFFKQEGHTLWNNRSMTTRVPSKGGFRENMMIMRADLASALTILTPEEHDAVLYVYYETAQVSGRKGQKKHILAEAAIDTMADFLNCGEALRAPPSLPLRYSRKMIEHEVIQMVEEAA